ncbi:putative mitochondrial protein [Cucumis melo var. makuwa]|uniref:Mitochondrial protein n=2 Tax=Cucumis melo var. makuwa TaxID=1194695 RepID=A0A5A7TDQ6_CUCMM|nr:putative mitochondrial protein [Cucumis melo var. makuwa]
MNRRFPYPSRTTRRDVWRRVRIPIRDGRLVRGCRSSKKQSVVSRSSTESEYRALADATAELLWLRWLLADMGVPQQGPTLLHCDNRSAIQIAHNDVFHERTKHIENDCHFIRHHLLSHTLLLQSISTTKQPADIFTKALPSTRFNQIRTKLKLTATLPP